MSPCCSGLQPPRLTSASLCRKPSCFLPEPLLTFSRQPAQPENKAAAKAVVSRPTSTNAAKFWVIIVSRSRGESASDCRQSWKRSRDGRRNHSRLPWEWEHWLAGSTFASVAQSDLRPNPLRTLVVMVKVSCDRKCFGFSAVEYRCTLLMMKLYSC